MKKIKVVFTDQPMLLPSYLEEIQDLNNAEVKIYQGYAEDEEQLYLRGKGADVIIVDVYKNYNRSLISRWPDLKAIIAASVGIDHIDIDYCEKRGIKVINFPGFNARAVAEMAFANLISLLRKVPLAQAHVKAGGWEYQYFEGFELEGKKLGVVGGGNIGRELINIGRGLGMEILCTTKHPTDIRARELEISRFYQLDEVLRLADFVVVAVRATRETENLINASAIAKMKKSAILVNVARWKIVDSLALAKALYEKRIAGAALDVIGIEPFDIRKADLRLQEMVNSPNVILTPHIAWNTQEAARRLGERVVATVRELCEK